MTTTGCIARIARIAICSFIAGLALAFGAQEPQPSSPDALSAQQQKVQELYPRLAASTVALFAGDPPRHQGSGVMIDPTGLVLTHGHHRLEPGAAITVRWADGRSANGALLGVDEYFDQSLIRLDERGPWPAVSLGSAAGLEAGEPCLLLGYPKVYYRDGRPPLLRVGQVIVCAGHHVYTSATTLGGDSGGPLFDLEGALVGTHQQQELETRGSGQVQIDVFRMLREDLLAGKHVRRGAEGKHPLQFAPAIAAAAQRVRSSVVALLVNDEPRALGVLLEPGWVLTKASELGSPLTCRMASGEVLAAAVQNADAGHDLALLRVEGAIGGAVWSERLSPAIGETVFTVFADGALQVSTVGSPPLDLAAEYGELAFNVEPAPSGVAGAVVTSIWQGKAKTARAIEVGDTITHLGDVPTPDAKTFFAARQFEGRSYGVVGNTVSLAIVRGGKTLRVDAPVESRSNIQLDEYLGRRTGFPAVFVHDRPVLRRLLGGPVFDTAGKVLGIDVASEPGCLTYAVPAGVARGVAETLRAIRVK